MDGPLPGGALSPTVRGTIVHSITVGGGVGVDVKGMDYNCVDVLALYLICFFRAHTRRNSRETYYTVYMSQRKCCSGYRDVRGRCMRKFIPYRRFSVPNPRNVHNQQIF